MESPPDRLAVVVSPTDVVQDSQLQLQTQNLELEKMNLKLQKQNVELQEHFNLVLKSKDPKRNEPSTGPFFHRYKSISPQFHNQATNLSPTSGISTVAGGWLGWLTTSTWVGLASTCSTAAGII